LLSERAARWGDAENRSIEIADLENGGGILVANSVLNELVSRAVVSDEFRSGILNGQRADLLRGFRLESDEIAEVMAIRANTLQEFSTAIERIMTSREARPFLHTIAKPMTQSSGETTFLPAFTFADLHHAL
jgi:hypothetical protein